MIDDSVIDEKELDIIVKSLSNELLDYGRVKCQEITFTKFAIFIDEDLLLEEFEKYVMKRDLIPTSEIKNELSQGSLLGLS